MCINPENAKASAHEAAQRKKRLAVTAHAHATYEKHGVSRYRWSTQEGEEKKFFSHPSLPLY